MVVEELPQLLFALAAHAAHHLGGADAQKRNADLSSHRLRQQRLATARGTVQENASGRVDSDVCVDLRMREWVLDEFADVLENAVNSRKVTVQR